MTIGEYKRFSHDSNRILEEWVLTDYKRMNIITQKGSVNIYAE